MRKHSLHTFILFLFLAFMVIQLPSAQAQIYVKPTIDRITATYMVPRKPKEGEEQKSEYDVLAEWEVHNHEEWLNFSGSLENLPEGYFPKISKEELAENDIMIIKVKTVLGEVFQEITLFNGTITVKDSRPAIHFYHDRKKFFPFLEKTRKEKRRNGEIGINRSDYERGLFIEYDEYKNIPDPMWVITKPREIDDYLSYVRNLPTLEHTYKINHYPLITDDSYILTFKPKDKDLPDRILVKNPYVITFKENNIISFYKDTMDYMSFFKKKALEVVKEEQEELEKRKRIAIARAKRKQAIDEKIKERREMRAIEKEKEERAKADKLKRMREKLELERNNQTETKEE